MKFKYYLRGAGIGIIVSTIILSAASLFQDNMSDAEVIQRAMDLGMVMEEGTDGTLADMSNQGNIDSNASTVQDDGQNEDGNGQPSFADDGQDVDNTGKGDTANQDHMDKADDSDDNGNSGHTDNQETQPDSPSSEDDKNMDNQAGQSDQEKDSKENKEKIKVKVEGGDVSRAVSQKVFEAGLVEDAEEFNNYLGDHGYDNSLQPGTYHIKKGASFQQIAEILTNK